MSFLGGIGKAVGKVVGSVGKAIGSVLSPATKEVGKQLNNLTGVTDTAERSLNDQVYLWNLQNAYNQPSSQIARMADAGIDINPMTYAVGNGNMSTTAGSIGSPNYSGSGINPIATAMSVAQGIQQMRAKQNDIRNDNIRVNNETQRVNNETQRLALEKMSLPLQLSRDAQSRDYYNALTQQVLATLPQRMWFNLNSNFQDNSNGFDTFLDYANGVVDLAGNTVEVPGRFVRAFGGRKK